MIGRMAELKTKETGASVDVFLAKIAGEERRRDCVALVKLMSSASGARPKMWGAGIVGFGSRRLKYESGRELDWFPIGFASRKQDIALYGLLGGEAEALLDNLGKHSRAKGCLYLKRLADVDTSVLERLMKKAVRKK